MSGLPCLCLKRRGILAGLATATPRNSPSKFGEICSLVTGRDSAFSRCSRRSAASRSSTLDFEPSGTAASAVSETFGAAVLLNAKNARWRRNHDLAHELFHLLTWSLFHPVAGGSMVAEEQEEKLATTFASNLLMPSDPFGSAIQSRGRGDKITFESLFDIAREFDVSVESVLWRMHIHA